MLRYGGFSSITYPENQVAFYSPTYLNSKVQPNPHTGSELFSIGAVAPRNAKTAGGGGSGGMDDENLLG